MCQREPGNRRRSKSRLDTRELSDALVFGLLELFMKRHDGVKGSIAQSVVDRVNELFDEGLSREQVYPVFREGLSRGFVTLNPPWRLALAQRIMDRYGIKPSEQKVIVVNVNTDPVAAIRAVEFAAAHIIKLIIMNLDGESRIHVGLGTGAAVLRCTNIVGQLLRAEYFGHSRLSVHPIEPPGYSAAYPDTSPVSFARLLETPWNKVVIRPRKKEMNLDLAVLDAHEGERSALMSGANVQNLVLLAGPGGLRSVQPWFEKPRSFTHAILALETAARLVEAEGPADEIGGNG
ncbi:MAG: hypothetical protein ABIP48_18495 [Planctomycetota bacterium]